MGSLFLGRRLPLFYAGLGGGCFELWMTGFHETLEKAGSLAGLAVVPGQDTHHKGFLAWLLQLKDPVSQFDPGGLRPCAHG